MFSYSGQVSEPIFSQIPNEGYRKQTGLEADARVNSRLCDFACTFKTSMQAAHTPFAMGVQSVCSVTALSVHE